MKIDPKRTISYMLIILATVAFVATAQRGNALHAIIEAAVIIYNIYLLEKK